MPTEPGRRPPLPADDRPVRDEEDEGLERHPAPGEMPSDVNVQAERQEEGVEVEYEEAEVERRRHAAERRLGE